MPGARGGRCSRRAAACAFRRRRRAPRPAARATRRSRPAEDAHVNPDARKIDARRRSTRAIFARRAARLVHGAKWRSEHHRCSATPARRIGARRAAARDRRPRSRRDHLYFSSDFESSVARRRSCWRSPAAAPAIRSREGSEFQARGSSRTSTRRTPRTGRRSTSPANDVVFSSDRGCRERLVGIRTSTAGPASRRRIRTACPR